MNNRVWFYLCISKYFPGFTIPIGFHSLSTREVQNGCSDTDLRNFSSYHPQSQKDWVWNRSLGAAWSNPQLKQGPPELVVQVHIQRDFDYLWGWRLFCLSGQVCQCLATLTVKTCFLMFRGTSCVPLCACGLWSWHWDLAQSLTLSSLHPPFKDLYTPIKSLNIPWPDPLSPRCIFLAPALPPGLRDQGFLKGWSCW